MGTPARILLFTAISVIAGALLTVSITVAGAAGFFTDQMEYGWFMERIGDCVPVCFWHRAIGRQWDVGWYTDEDGSVIEYVVSDEDEQRYLQHFSIRLRASAARRPKQEVYYDVAQIGWPWRCTEVWHHGFPLDGLHRMRPGDPRLRSFPRWRLQSIAVGALAANAGFFTGLAACATLAGRVLRRTYVRHKQRRAARAGRCVRCGYDLRGSPTAVCSECGMPSTSAGDQTRSSDRECEARDDAGGS